MKTRALFAPFEYQNSSAHRGLEQRSRIDIEEGPSGLTVRGSPQHAPTPIGGPAPTGSVTAFFRDDAARIESPDYRGTDEITLRGIVTLRTYPGGHYRYVVAVGDREYTVKDARLIEIGTPVGLCLPLHTLHLFANEAASVRGH
jgi:TOBE domain